MTASIQLFSKVVLPTMLKAYRWQSESSSTNFYRCDHSSQGGDLHYAARTLIVDSWMYPPSENVFNFNLTKNN